MAGYCLAYAPYGLNETDGGFVTGLAWQVLSGKSLYQDILYVRPPLPVWLRALEMKIMPEQWAVLGERCFFYLKMAAYSYWGASVLAQGEKRWALACFGFVVSAHCYPAMAWHTVDGLFFSVLACWLTHRRQLFAAGAALALALLCKQSFYPLAPFFLLALGLEKDRRWPSLAWFSAGMAAVGLVFAAYSAKNGLWGSYWLLTAGSTTGGQAWQHGVLDYFRIEPLVGVPSLLLLPALFWAAQKGRWAKWAYWGWAAWLGAVALSFAAVAWWRQEHTVPFSQARLMFWVGAAWLLYRWHLGERPLALALLLAVSWSASVSWGYSLPILFALPWVFAAMEWGSYFRGKAGFAHKKWLNVLAFALLLAVFRLGFEFVYRDGRRGDMTHDMGKVFPALNGIFSDGETVRLYLDLKHLAGQYGPNFTVLPAFPQANFLTKTYPPLPLDWVVNRETNGDNAKVWEAIFSKKPYLLVQKAYQDKIGADPELEVTRQALRRGALIAETSHFWVVRPEP